ncbi:winged helix-turn-helix domain-containing protein [Kitasatospora viridis]|uniref:ArsR family transcriptional regulator n=1 Tax=Kitasatospora viridis TaxID=281105 RepID=A0A561SG76_9ACTN|nr:helix-turn-helix domain-containing protein [Kitasatospora viridis]TWF73872.1 ArsR family transcriptional regulator [Kitasatospora viridis]
MSEPTDDFSRVVLDAKGLKALAHPVRVRLLALLRRNGPSTATRLATELDLNSGATSYHLRQLAAAGFVAEDTERGNARDRWWRAVYQATRLDDNELANSEDGQAFLQSVLALHTQRARRTINELPTMASPWRETFDLSDWSLRLTPEEAHRLNAELAEVVGRYRRHDAGAEGPAGTERVALIIQQLPEPEGAEDEPC